MTIPFSYLGMTLEPTPSPYTLTLVFTTGNAPNRTVEQWNTLLGGNYTAVQVVGDNVLLTGGSNVTTDPNTLSGETNLAGVTDDGSIVGLGTNSFSSTPNLENVALAGCLTVGDSCLSNTSGASGQLNLELPVCTALGATTGDDGLFDGTTGITVVATFNSALETCNSGNPDGDIQELESNNTCTITYV